MRHITLTLLAAVAGAFLVVAGAHVVQALVAGTGADVATDGVERIIPFKGTLWYDGAPYTGDVELRVELYAASDCAGTAVWTEAHDTSVGRAAIAVNNGAFTAALGQYEALTTDVLARDTLYARTAVRLPGDASWTTFGDDCQLLTRAPFSLWAGGASAMQATGAVRVGGAAALQGTLRVTEELQLPKPNAAITFGRYADGSEVTSGEGGFTFGAEDGSEGAALLYDVASDELRLEASDATALALDVEAGVAAFSGDVTFEGGGTVATDTTLADDADDLVLAAGSSLYVDGAETIAIAAPASGRRGVSWADADPTQGAQVVYDTATNELRFESTFAFGDGADLMTVDLDNGNAVIPGAVTMSNGAPIVDRNAYAGSSVTDVEANGLDKTFIADSSCTSGYLRVGAASNDQPSICVCANNTAEEGRGWYCFE